MMYGMAHVISYFFSTLLYDAEDAREDVSGRRWIAGDIPIDLYHVRDCTDDRVRAFPYAARACAIPQRDNYLGLRRKLVCGLECVFHVARDGAGHREDVCMTRRRDKRKAEAFDIIVRIGECGHLIFLRIRRPRVDVPNAECATPIKRTDGFFQILPR